MGTFTRILPLLVAAVTVACTSPSTGTTEDRSGNAAATITSLPSAAGDGAGAEGAPGVGSDGQDGQDGQDGRSGHGDDSDGKDTGTPPDRGSYSATTNDVLIGANFAGAQGVPFGSTSPGSTATRTVRVGSLGETTVSSVSVSSGTSTFRLLDNGCTGTRFPGPSCQVTVTASPSTEGEHKGTLEISYTTAGDKHGRTTVKLTVSGEGAASELKSSGGGTTEPEVPQESPTESPPTTSG